MGTSGAVASAWQSADGADWEVAAMPEPEEAGVSAMHDVAANPTGVAAIGSVGEAPAAWWSLDGTAWTRSPRFTEDHAILAHLTAIPGGFAIAGNRRDRPADWLSSDGRAWSAVDLPIAAGAKGQADVIRATENGLVVFGYSTQDEGHGGSSRTAYLVWTLKAAE